MQNISGSAPSSVPHPATGSYKVGDRDDRPWGSYIVTGVGIDISGVEYCEKTIVVNPWQALSLQSHELRRETWTVRQGALTALVDGERIELKEGQSLQIPEGSIHCMANLGDTNCIVAERQEGICREDDIKRYADAYSRATEAAIPAVARSAAVYNAILSEVRNKGKRAKSAG
jgi:mannose-6-phosphate isomerase-like protein (cupin superfamily)